MRGLIVTGLLFALAIGLTGLLASALEEAQVASHHAAHFSPPRPVDEGFGFPGAAVLESRDKADDHSSPD